MIPKTSILNNNLIKLWYDNCVPASRYIYFKYLRNYKNIIFIISVLLLITILFYGSIGLCEPYWEK